MRLIQEDYRDDPWKMLVSCILLNQTTNAAVRKILPDLFRRWPNARAMSEANIDELSEILRPLGLFNIRSRSIRNMSIGMLDNRPFGSLAGVGKYALDSLRMFYLNDLTVTPEDRKLKARLKELKNGQR